MEFLRRYWLFLLLYVIVGVAGLFEITGWLEEPGMASQDQTGLAEESPLIVDLYPNSPESDYIRGMNAKYLRYDLVEARRYFEKALSTGIRSHEELLYDYAVILFLEGADSTEVDTAVAVWRKHFPDSHRLDPREFFPRFPEWLQAGSLQPMSLSSDSQTFALVESEGDLTLLDLPSGTRTNMTVAPSDRIQHLFGFSQNGSLLAAGDSDGLVIVFNVKQLEEKTRLTGHTSGVLCAEFSPSGKICATGSLDHTIRLWEIESANKFGTLTGHSKPVSSLAFSSNGTWLASGSWDGSIQLWNLDSQPIKPVEFAGHQAVITKLAFSHHGKWLASAGRDGLVRIWNISTRQLRQELRKHTGPVATVAFSHDDRLLVSGAGDNSVKFWNAESGELIKSHENVSREGVCAVSFIPYSHEVIEADFKGSLRPLRVPITLGAHGIQSDE